MKTRNKIVPQLEAALEEGNRVMGADVYNYAITGDIAATFGANSGGTNTHGTEILDENVSKLTPVECERLMGFPDNYTLSRIKVKSVRSVLTPGDIMLWEIAWSFQQCAGLASG